MTETEIYNIINAIIPNNETSWHLTKKFCNEAVTNIKNVVSIELKPIYGVHVLFNGEWVLASNHLRGHYTTEGNYQYEIVLTF